MISESTTNHFSFPDAFPMHALGSPDPGRFIFQPRPSLGPWSQRALGGRWLFWGASFYLPNVSLMGAAATVPDEPEMEEPSTEGHAPAKVGETALPSERGPLRVKLEGVPEPLDPTKWFWWFDLRRLKAQWSYWSTARRLEEGDINHLPWYNYMGIWSVVVAVAGLYLGGFWYLRHKNIQHHQRILEYNAQASLEWLKQMEQHLLYMRHRCDLYRHFNGGNDPPLGTAIPASAFAPPAPRSSDTDGMKTPTLPASETLGPEASAFRFAQNDFPPPGMSIREYAQKLYEEQRERQHLH